MTRVLLLTPDFPPELGGIQLLMHRLAMHATQTEVRVATLRTHGADEFDAGGELDVMRVGTRRSRRASIAALNARAVLVARDWRPDVLLAGHIVGTPAAYAVKRMLGVPSVVYLHAKEVGASPRLAHHAVRTFDRIIVVSRYTAQLARDAGADAARLRRISPGVDAFDGGPRRAPDRPTILTIARLEDRYKGHDILVRALALIRARAKDVQWVVIGQGPLRRDIERLARTHGVWDSVRLLGAVSDAERDHWLAHSSVFCMPSRLPAARAGEGFGIVYLEAGAHGLPVVAGNVGGAVDAVVDGVTGTLVDPTNHVAVADAIADLLTDDELAARMGEAGRAHAAEFAWPLIARRVEHVFAELVG